MREMLNIILRRESYTYTNIIWEYLLAKFRFIKDRN